MTGPGPLLPVALEWLAAGGAPVPILMEGESKHPRVRWRHYHEQGIRPREAEVRAWFGNGSRDGLGLLSGHGGLEMFELEGQAVAEGKLAEFLAEVQARGLAPLWERIVAGYAEQSPSGGFHVIMRVTGGPPLKCTPLARRPETADELDARKMTKVEARKGVKKPRHVVQIETRGMPGFTVVAPTVKGDGRGWVLISGSPRTVAEVTAAERDALYDAARTCDTWTAWRAEQAPAAVPGNMSGTQVSGQAEAPSAALAFAALPGRTSWSRPGGCTSPMMTGGTSSGGGRARTRASRPAPARTAGCGYGPPAPTLIPRCPTPNRPLSRCCTSGWTPMRH